MKFFKPQIQLARRRNFDEPDEFFLHVVTFCNQANFRENGHRLHTETTNGENYLVVDLRIRRDPDFPPYDYITPVVHSIRLGALPFGGEARIEVNVIIDEEVQARGDKKKAGASTVSSTDADETSRPDGIG